MEFFNVYRTGNKVSIDDTSCATIAEAVDEHMLVSDIYTRSGGQYVWTLIVDGDKVTTIDLDRAIDGQATSNELDRRHDNSLRAGA